MGILNSVVVLPDTISIITSQKEVICNSCTNPISHDNVVTICWTVGICIAIIALTFCLCIIASNMTRRHEIDKSIENDKNRRNEEVDRQKEKERLDCAWRYLDVFYKKKESVASTNEETEMAKVAIQYLTNLIKQDTPTDRKP